MMKKLLLPLMFVLSTLGFAQGGGQFAPGSSGATSAAQVVAMFTGCSGVKYLAADGTCQTASGAATGVTGLPVVGDISSAQTSSNAFGIDASKYTTNTTTDMGRMIKDALASAQANNVGPTIRIPTLNSGAWAMTSDPFAGATQKGCHILQQGVTINTDVTIAPINKCDWIGTVKGDIGGVNGTGAAIAATSTWRTNYPRVQSSSVSDTICFLTGDNNIVAGTINAGSTACVVGGSTPFTSNLVGYILYIFPASTAVPGGITQNVGIPLGIVQTFTDSTHIALWRNVASPQAQPAASTGNIYAFIRPLGVIGTPTASACPLGSTCIGNQQRFENVTFECGDNSSGDANNTHVGLVNLYGQELEWWRDVGTRNCGWSEWVIATPGSQDSGYYSGIIGGGGGPSTELPVLVWQPGYFHGFMGNTTINTGVTETTDFKYVNTISQAGVDLLSIHGESATDLITCGELTTWSWVTGGTGCKNTRFGVFSAAGTITNTIHIVNSTGVPPANLVIEGTSGNAGPIAILDDVHGKSYTMAGAGPIWTLGADNFVDGHYDGDQPFPNYAAGGGTAQAQTVTLTTPLLALTTGTQVRWLPIAANSAAAPTLAVNAMTAKPITKCGSQALAANDLLSTVDAEATYDGTQWELMNPQTGSCGQPFTPVATDSGTANTYVINPVPAIPALVAGAMVVLHPANASNGASTINVNNLGVKNITKNGTVTLGADLVTTNYYLLIYDGTEWIVWGNALGCNTCTRTNGTPVNHQIGIWASANTIGNTSTTMQADATNSFMANYNSEALAGFGQPYLRGVTSQKTESAADASVLSVTPAAAVGSYRACFDLSVSAAVSATLGWTATWTDSNGNAQVPANLALSQTGVAAPALTFTTSAAADYYGCATFNVNNAGTAIVIKLTFAGTSFTAKATATIERLN